MKATLERLLDSPRTSNPAFNRLLDDYRNYHVVLVVGGGLFLVFLVWLGVVLWRRFVRAGKDEQATGTLTRGSVLVLALGVSSIALLTAVIVVANVSTAMDPRHGFSLIVSSLSTPPPHTRPGGVDHATVVWLNSASPRIPPLIESRVHARLSWQRPKAMVCGVLFAVVAPLSAWAWRRLIWVPRGEGVAGARKAGLLTIGAITALVALLLAVMAIANAQAAIAPVTISVFGASG